jgi:hypothetical protein
MFCLAGVFVLYLLALDQRYGILREVIPWIYFVIGGVIGGFAIAIRNALELKTLWPALDEVTNWYRVDGLLDQEQREHVHR